MRKYSVLESKEKSLLKEQILREVKLEDGLTDLSHMDEDLYKPRQYRNVASSTVEIAYDKSDIKSYTQIVGEEKIEYSPEEIIRLTTSQIDGKVNGFSSLESVIVQLELLRQMWQNMLSLMRKTSK